MVDFYDLSLLAELSAIEKAINPTYQSWYDAKCREFSILFHTPLDRVINELDATFVLKHLHENLITPSMVDEDIEGILENLYKIRDPNYSAISKQDIENLVDKALNKEIQRLSKSKKKSGKIKEAPETDLPQPPKKPKSGSMKFDDLEKQEAKDEQNKSGF